MELLDRIKDLIPEDKRKIVIFFCAWGLLLVIITIVFIVYNSGDKITTDDFVHRFEIPSEEIFFPEEPDFIPGVLLERERRAGWTNLDASMYWQDPLRYGEEAWREKVEAAIDELMERVP
jgi:uncharacterized integral membrane protein